MARAAASTSRNVVSVGGTAGSTSTATLYAPGTSSRSSSSRFAANSPKVIDAGQRCRPAGRDWRQDQSDRVFADAEDDRDRRGRRLGRQRRSVAEAGDHGDLPSNQIGCQLRQPIEVTLGPAIYDRDVVALDIARLLQALVKCAQAVRVRVGRSCGRGNRSPASPAAARAPRAATRRRAAEQRDELAPPHSITSSARASSDGGTSRPSALAVLRLMTNSNLVGACTGKSAGFSPLRMRST